MFEIGFILEFISLFFKNTLKRVMSFFEKNWKVTLILVLTILFSIFIYFTISYYQNEAKKWEDKYNSLSKKINKASEVAHKNVEENQKTVYVSQIVYKDRDAKQKIIYLQAKQKVDEYAKTPEGNITCRDAERVRQIDQLDADLFASTSAKDPR